MRYLGIDYGEKRIGLAVGDDETRLAAPLTTLANDRGLLGRLTDILVQEDIDAVVVGLPRGLDGQETKQTEEVQRFVGKLEDAGFCVETQDEAVTSELAQEQLKAAGRPLTKENIDKQAAAIFLQDFLDNL